MIKAIAAERQTTSTLTHNLAVCEAKIKGIEEEHSQLQRNHTKVKNELDIATQQLLEAAQLSVPLRDDLAL